MRYGFVAIAFALVIAAVSAQIDLTAFPNCGMGCVVDSIAGTGCALTDYGCICQNGQLFQLLVPCAASKCEKADQQKIYGEFQTACSSYHVIPPLPSSLLTTSATTTSGIFSNTSSATATPTVIFDLASIPSCAASCAISAIKSTSCPPTDYKCACRNENFTNNLGTCVPGVCSESDQQKIFDLSRDLCAANGISVTIIPATTGVGGNHENPTATTPGTTFRATTPSSTATRTSSSAKSSSTSTAGAAKMTGSGFVVAAVMGVALFVL